MNALCNLVNLWRHIPWTETSSTSRKNEAQPFFVNPFQETGLIKTTLDINLPNL